MRLSQYQKVKILIMHAKGNKSQDPTAKHIKRSQSSVSEVISKFEKHRTTDIMPGGGRKRKTSQRTDN